MTDVPYRTSLAWPAYGAASGHVSQHISPPQEQLLSAAAVSNPSPFDEVASRLQSDMGQSSPENSSGPGGGESYGPRRPEC